jgi:hypothetical protein
MNITLNFRGGLNYVLTFLDGDSDFNGTVMFSINKCFYLQVSKID